MRFRLRSPRRLAQVLLAAARRDRDEVEKYLDDRPEEWEALVVATPSDAADVLEELYPDAAADLIGDLDPSDAADLFEEISPELAAELLTSLDPTLAGSILSETVPDHAADLIGELDDGTATVLLAKMSPEAAAAARELLIYPADSAGGLMTRDIAVLPLGLVAGEATERIRQLREQYEDLSYVYVADSDGRLVGVVSFRDLVFARPGDPLDGFMVSEPVSVTTFTDREEVAELAQRYHLRGIPVTDGSGILLGMVTTDSVLETIFEEASEDFAASVGAGIEETVYSPMRRAVRGRTPWLIVNLVLSLFIAFIVERQTGVISSEPVLAALMPVIALLGGNGGAQSLAVVIRSLAADDIPGSRVLSIITRQMGVGLLIGLTLAVLTAGATAILITSNVFQSSAEASRVAAVVGLATLVNLTWGSLAGTGIPLALRRIGLDPAVASSIFLTLTTDALGFGGFLLVASIFLV
ncbi:MAG: magnesium transporter [Acidimicrobiia bacterium]|nr:magnesium transporter [Acidimicrobiia bacterium]